MPFLDDPLDFFIIYHIKGSLVETGQEVSHTSIPSQGAPCDITIPIQDPG